MNLDRALISGLLYPDYDKDMPQDHKYKLLESVRHTFSKTNVLAFEYVSRFYRKFGKFPRPDTVKEKYPNMLIMEPTEPYKYYLNEAIEMRTAKKISDTIKGVEERMALGDRKGALEFYISSARQMEILDVTSRDVDMKRDFEEFKKDYLLKQSQLEEGDGIVGYATGLDTLDMETGGILPGDYWSILGRPGSLKTYTLCKFAVSFADQMDGIVSFVSREMVARHVLGRILAVSGEESYSLLRRYKLDEETMEKIGRRMNKIRGNIRITDEVRDVAGIKAKAMEHEASLLIMDGLYLFAKSEDWKDQATVSRTARAIALELNIPAVSSLQFNRKGSKKMHIDNAGLTDAIGQDASVVIGQQRVYDEILEKPLDQVKLEILKSRDDRTGKSFLVYLDFKKSLFTENPESDGDGEIWTIEKDLPTVGLAENEIGTPQ